MKGFVAIILFFVLALVGIKAGYPSVTFSVAAVEEQSEVLYDSPVRKHKPEAGTIIPLESKQGLADMELNDAHTLAHRLSISAERLCRFSSTETVQYIKALLRKLAIRMDVLACCSERVYDSSRSLSWEDACEHYIFGMRRILI